MKPDETLGNQQPPSNPKIDRWEYGRLPFFGREGYTPPANALEQYSPILQSSQGASKTDTEASHSRPIPFTGLRPQPACAIDDDTGCCMEAAVARSAPFPPAASCGHNPRPSALRDDHDQAIEDKTSF